MTNNAYAANTLSSKGRLFPEPPSETRNLFQRDRDRIIHSSSFRRLQYKTQVYVSHEGDMYRNRLTHSLEVAQISRGIARTLGCHEDLAEAIALAHDLGHTPFGHAGQDKLHECMAKFGGFEHNFQSLRVVDYIENRYASFRGLNLTFETREGILKHCSRKKAAELGELGLRFLNGEQASLEAQIVNHADEIAYCHHDIDDGIRSGILNFDQLKELTLFSTFLRQVDNKYAQISREQRLNETIRRMMHFIIKDLCQTTLTNLTEHQPRDIDHVRLLPAMVGFSKSMTEKFQELKVFSRKNIYQHERIHQMSVQAWQTIEKLFQYLTHHIDEIPQEYQDGKQDSHERLVADYISGMTDRYALNLVNKLQL